MDRIVPRVRESWAVAALSPVIARFLADTKPETPCLVMGLGVVEDRYQTLAAGLPDATADYEIKVKSEVEVAALLDELGASFDVGSPSEIDLCVKVGVAADRISYGNTVKKERDIGGAFDRGVPRFAFYSAAEL